MMRKMLFTLSMIVLSYSSGCVSVKVPDQYIEGTVLTCGLWIPYNGQLYGLQALQFIQGRKMTSSTNFNVKSGLSTTNDFPMMKSSLRQEFETK